MIHNKQDTMGSRTQQKIDKNVLDAMTMSGYSNYVLIRVCDFKKERKTKAGILLDVNPDVQYLDGEGSHMADLERVVGTVEKVPPTLRPDGDMLQWHTTMDLVVGDVVYFDYYDSINSISFVCGDDEYRLIPYASCYLAIRDDEMVGLNGYCLLEDVYEVSDGFSPHPTLQDLMGTVYFASGPVVHCLDYYTEDIKIEKGDLVVFRKKFAKVYLERQEYFQTLGKKLFRAQRKDIVFNYGPNTQQNG